MSLEFKLKRYPTIQKIFNFINLFLLTKTEQKAFICIFLISLISLISLIKANVLYLDDIGRVLNGSTRWETDGRPLATITNLIIQLGKPLTDISPLPQIFALALYSLSSIYLGKIFKVNDLTFLTLGGIIFVLNPFNLQNFSYIFDSFSMSLAIFCSIIAYIPIKNFYVKGGYASSKDSIAPFNDMGKIFIHNLFYSLRYVQESLGNRTLFFLILILLSAMILSLIFLIVSNAYQHKFLNQNQLFFIVVLSLMYVLILISSFQGLGLILVNPVWQPRTFMGFSGVVAIACFCISKIFNFSQFIRYFLIFFMSLLCLSFINVSLTFGNALYYQNIQEERVATLLFSDLEAEIFKSPNTPENPKIIMAGQLRENRLNSVAFKKYPILKKMIQPLFREKFYWGYTKLISLGFEFEFNYKLIENFTVNDQTLASDFKLLLNRRLYKIFYDQNDTFIIFFKE